jgi:uncharacterized protein (TIGR03000 family)
MYSVVLMAALTTSSSTPNWGRHSCCAPAGYNACYGYSGVGYTCRGWMGHAGVYAGSYGNNYYGACYGCYGGYGRANYYGGYYGGCYGGYANPVWGAGYGYGGIGAGCTGCYGCYGGYSCYGIPLQPGVNYISPPLGTQMNPAPAPIPPIEVTPEPKIKKTEKQTRAKVRVEIPADAKLFVDGMLMNTTSAVRMFQTPVLNANQTYYYELKAELTRNNQTYTDVQRIAVRPGEQTSATFAGLEQQAAAAAQTAPATAQR